MSQQETSAGDQQAVPKAHVHIDADHEAIAENIFGAISIHIAKHGAIENLPKEIESSDSPGEFYGSDKPIQLVPGNSNLNSLIAKGKMPGGAEGQMIKKRLDAERDKKKAESETHVIK